MRDAVLLRISRAVVQTMSGFSVARDLHRDWRNDVEGRESLFSDRIPNYRNRMTSYFARKRADAGPGRDEPVLPSERSG